MRCPAVGARRSVDGVHGARPPMVPPTAYSWTSPKDAPGRARARMGQHDGHRQPGGCWLGSSGRTRGPRRSAPSAPPSQGTALAIERAHGKEPCATAPATDDAAGWNPRKVRPPAGRRVVLLDRVQWKLGQGDSHSCSLCRDDVDLAVAGRHGGGTVASSGIGVIVARRLVAGRTEQLTIRFPPRKTAEDDKRAPRRRLAE